MDGADGFVVNVFERERLSERGLVGRSSSLIYQFLHHYALKVRSLTGGLWSGSGPGRRPTRTRSDGESISESSFYFNLRCFCSLYGDLEGTDGWRDDEQKHEEP